MKVTTGFQKFLGLSASIFLLAATGCATRVGAQPPVPASTVSQPPATPTPTSLPDATGGAPAPISSSPAETTTETTTAVAPWDDLPPAITADFTPAQMYADYKADPAAADARYFGKVFTFNNINIDEMALLYKGMAEPGDAWVISGMVYFRTMNKSRIMNLEVNDIIDVTGQVMGTVQNYVLVGFCTYSLVDSTNGVVRPNWIDIPG
jgi:hypothetical protein